MKLMTRLTDKFLDCSHFKPYDKTGKPIICKCNTRFQRQRNNLRMYFTVLKKTQ